ncbi:hypothetical protein COY65_00935 [Candidatus Jorgensenbacteria bacterium CG_4_10_14_0_8_um_filter_39_13]|uniref:Nucleotidyl transferase AbiEii/AbiGii toxin family protein n=1 Tax=Candidatus Jorgensenbacteria bacterium CG_4_10_14_0_8_um_filter_39_13 TaxID=1974589 RepID=A0A2M7RIU3_9BACT|nr:MAG: hypothetical protein COY65_00935 [Candidatus Jorgensenbacteria bacterium CG_4_10_14_0_8_um_filter_39_13]
MYEKALVNKEAKKLFPRFGKFSDFYLVGGTALALQIGHRISVDFDFFSGNELPTGLLQKIKRIFPDPAIEVIYREAREQITLLLDRVKITFFHYSYPVIDRFVKYQGVPMATVREIAAMKAFSIGKRLSYKDYIDWYFLLKEKYIDLKGVIALAEKKFNGDFNNRLFLGQLVSISDVPILPIDFLRDAIDKKTVQNFLEKTVRNFKF